MNIIQALILGIVQGLTELLPISSSAHLNLFPWLFNWGEMSASFDVALHIGTLLALVIFFFKDWVNLVKGGYKKAIKKEDSTEGKIFWYLIVATIPAGIVGVLFEDIFDNFFRKQIWLIAIALIVMGIIIYLVDKKSKQEKKLSKMTVKDAIIIGISQVFALIPGFSRSGTTIAAARSLGIKRDDAAKFSFYLSAPVVLGAVGVQLLKPNTYAVIATNPIPFIIGILTSFIVGLVCIKYLLKYLHKHNFKVFMIYRIALAIIVLLTIIVRR